MLVKYVNYIEDEIGLIMNQLYVVLIIEIDSGGSICYGLKNSLEKYNWISFYSSECFEIISSEIPSGWSFFKSNNKVKILPKEWQVEDFILRFSNYELKLYAEAEKIIKKLILEELPFEEFEKELNVISHEICNNLNKLDYILEMIIESSDKRFISYMIKIAENFKTYSFNQIYDKIYQEEVRIFKNIFIYLSIFKENLDVENYFIECLVNGDEKFSDIINNYLKK